MRKSKQKIIISISIIAGMIMLLYLGGMFSNQQISGLPDKNKLSFIEVYIDYNDDETKYHIIESDEDIFEIYDVLMTGKKSSVMHSVNDVPVNIDGSLARIILTDSNNICTSLYAYKADDEKYYIEIPYGDIYEISADKYEILTQYFMTDNIQ